ncbi:MAG: hypothetical protein KY432_08505 [Acidobacteria bacterium]|nr:hypothetical protein [Acidobacteriota bacterium]
MRYRRAVLTLLAAVLLALPAAAAHYSDFYVIPVAGHVPGVNDTFFRSDIAIHNFQDTPITVDMALVESGIGLTNNVFAIGDPVTVAARGSVLLEDVLDGYRGMESVLGSILIGADKPFAVVSRAFTNAEDGGTYGQTIPAVADFLDNVSGVTDPAMARAWIPGARSDSEFRTNIGFVAGSGDSSSESLAVKVRLYDQSGGSLGTETFLLPGGTFNHTQFNTSVITGETFTVAGVEITIPSGNGAVIPYISVVDNETGDGWFVLGTFPPNQPAGKTGQMSEFRQLFDQVMRDR